MRTLTTNGVDLAITEEGHGRPVILAHGFPELAYSWRHQIPALAAAGYHAVAPDQRGYGRSSRPERIEDYNIEQLSADLLGVLDDLGEEKAVFVGHDWGSMVVWHLSIAAPERVAGVAGMSVPFIARPAMPPIQIMRQMFGDAFFYMLYFQEPGVADAELASDPAKFMRRMLAGLSSDSAGSLADFMANDGRGFADRLPEPDGLPDWITQEEIDHYVAEFSRTGFTGGINWYRNMDRNWELTEHLAGKLVEVPSLFVGGSADPVLVMSPPSNMEGLRTDDRGTLIIEGAGHWVQQERPDEVNRALLEFVASIDGYEPTSAT